MPPKRTEYRSKLLEQEDMILLALQAIEKGQIQSIAQPLSDSIYLSQHLPIALKTCYPAWIYALTGIN
jgi:hypothetical protein